MDATLFFLRIKKRKQVFYFRLLLWIIKLGKGKKKKDLKKLSQYQTNERQNCTKTYKETNKITKTRNNKKNKTKAKQAKTKTKTKNKKKKKTKKLKQSKTNKQLKPKSKHTNTNKRTV